MKYAREALVLASMVIGVLANGLLFSIGWWRDYNLIQHIVLWVAGASMIAYCFYRFLKAVARGGLNENNREA